MPEKRRSAGARRPALTPAQRAEGGQRGGPGNGDRNRERGGRYAGRGWNEHRLQRAAAGTCRASQLRTLRILHGGHRGHAREHAAMRAVGAAAGRQRAPRSGQRDRGCRRQQLAQHPQQQHRSHAPHAASLHEEPAGASALSSNRGDRIPPWLHAEIPRRRRRPTARPCRRPHPHAHLLQNHCRGISATTGLHPAYIHLGPPLSFGFAKFTAEPSCSPLLSSGRQVRMYIEPGLRGESLISVHRRRGRFSVQRGWAAPAWTS